MDSGFGSSPGNQNSLVSRLFPSAKMFPAPKSQAYGSKSPIKKNYRSPSKINNESVNNISKSPIKHQNMKSLPPMTSDDSSTQIRVKTESPAWVDPADFVEFILNHESLAEEFCYMISLGPYEYKIVPYSVIDQQKTKDYLTISIRGVTQYKNNDVEFISLQEWQKSQELYRKIIELSFFSMYKRWKSFYVWKRTYRSLRFQKCKRTLEQNLFSLDPTLHDPLMDVKGLCLSLSRDIRLLNSDTVKPWTETEFIDAQATRKSEIMDTIQRTWDIIIEKVRATCKISLENFLDLSNIERERNRDGEGDVEEGLAALESPSRGGTNTSSPQRGGGSTLFTAKHIKDATQATILSYTGGQNYTGGVISKEEKAAAADSYTARATKRTQCRKLSKFIRYCNYYYIEALQDIARSSLEEFDNRLIEFKTGAERAIIDAQRRANETEAEAEEREARALLATKEGKEEEGPLSPMLSMSCRIDSSTLEFTPSEGALRKAIDSSLMTALTQLCSKQSFLSLEQFSEFTSPLAELAEGGAPEGANGQGGSNDVFGIISKDKKFCDLVSAVASDFRKLFDMVVDYSKRLHPIVQSYIEFQNTTEQDLARLDSVEAFAERLQAFMDAQIIIDGIPEVEDIGIFRLELAQFKREVSPAPKLCLAMIQDLLPRLTSEKAESLTALVRAHQDRLLSKSHDVDEFVSFQTFVAQLSDDLADLDAKYAQVLDLSTLQTTNSIKHDSKSITFLTQLYNDMKNSLSEAQDKMDSQQKRFRSELDDDIPKMKGKCADRAHLLQDPILADPTASISEVLERINELEVEVNDTIEVAKRYNRYQEALGLEITPFEYTEELSRAFKIRADLWRSLDRWNTKSGLWCSQLIKKLDVDALNKEVKSYQKLCNMCEAQLEGNMVVTNLKHSVEQFSAALPVVSAISCPALQNRHWQEIRRVVQNPEDYDPIIGLIILKDEAAAEDEEITAADIESEMPTGELHILQDPGLTIGVIITLGVDSFSEHLADIQTRAMSEAKLENDLRIATQDWENIQFEFKDPGNLPTKLLAGDKTEEIQATLENSLATVSTIAGNKYVGPIRDRVEGWQRSLQLVNDTLEQWLLLQKNWLYLQSIFSSTEIKKQLTQECRDFGIVDSSWKSLMSEAYQSFNVLKLCTVPNRKQELTKHNENLEAIEKSLEDFLEHKRLGFPRFFFLSNDELLTIVAHCKDPKNVQPHLRKLFDALVKLEFISTPNSETIISMYSPEDENIKFINEVRAKGEVGNWLSFVESQMFQAVRNEIRLGLDSYEVTPRKEWVSTVKAQVASCVAQIRWCFETEKCFNEANIQSAMEQWAKRNVLQLSGLTELVRGELTPAQRLSICALAIQDVHNRDIIDDLVQNQVHNKFSFKWQQQLKYYWTNEDCIIHQVDATIPYGYEYQGATTRLVITPLTDRCWLTITGALHIKLGAAPAGPAGTGKTESTKDLAKSLARRCVVFNCSDQITYKMIGTLYSGVVAAGAWTCLDEFNRIDIEVLSVIAQQLLTIRTAQLADLSEFDFEHRHLPLKPHCGVFITMNPGYAGRTELPDNLKVLFRPVSMMVPDYTLIAEIMLFSEGFGDAKILSGKFTKLYKLSSEQLSKQDHYDFGMRAVKSVLVMAGGLKRKNPDNDEDLVLIRAMRDSNVPKFLSHDLPLFNAIVQDLFPGRQLPYADKSELTNAIKDALIEQKLQPHNHLSEKIIQLFETFEVRFGVMLVGPTASGKTTCYKTLAKAMTSLRKAESKNQEFQEVEYKVLNPKCVSMGELYGEMNSANEWQNGLASNIMRGFVDDESSKRKWTVFDGPVDALWIENMNTVLDDNMTLCLANGERIKLRPQMRMLFEVQDLAVASPATVSRCGMVYLQPTDLGYDSYVKSWIQNNQNAIFKNETVLNHVDNLFSTHVKSAIDMLRRVCTEPVTTQDNALVHSLCKLFDSIINPDAGSPNGVCSNDSGTPDEEAPAFNLSTITDEKDICKRITLVFAFSLLWAIGGGTDTISREKFAQHVTMSFSEQINWPRNCFDCFVDLKEGKLRPWDELKPTFTYNPKASYFELIVPSIDTTRYAYVLDKSIMAQNSIFLSGPTGVGKSVIIHWLLEALKARGRISPAYITFSAQTRSDTVQKSIESRFKSFGTRLSSSIPVVIYVDDVNMPSVEEYGAQPPIELLRQLQDQGGFYSRGSWTMRHVSNSTLLLSAAPPGGGRAELTPRFTRHSHVVCMTSTSSESMTHIFESILSSFLLFNSFKPEISQMARATVESTIEMFERICKELLPTPSRSHYTFNLRDVSKVIQGILQVKPRNCSSLEKLAKLWTHETMRVFHDRLINDEDRNWFYEASVRIVQSRLRQADASVDSMYGPEKLNMFGDFVTPAPDIESRLYEDVDSLSKAVQLMDRACNEYNYMHSNATMPLVFFKDAAEHVSRILRILRQPRGNAMLVGVGGSGKSSMTRLAAHMYEMELLEIVIVKSYDVQNFRDDIKAAMVACAKASGSPVVFFLTDSQIIRETFLEDVNNVLNSGEVPNLWSVEELDENYMDLVTLCKERGLSEARDAVSNFFVQRVRNNLHVVLSMSPVGEALRIRMRMFPSLVNCCTIDWFKAWPADALYSVAKKLINSVEGVSDEVKNGLVNMCVDVHLSVSSQADKFLQRYRRHVYISPKSYLDLINLYKSILKETSENLSTQQQRLKTGLLKLDKTKDDIVQLNEQLQVMQPKIEKAREEAEQLLVSVTIVKGKAEIEQKSVEKVKTEVQIKADAAASIANEANEKLQIAMPALERAEKAAGDLKPADMTNLRTMPSPPERAVESCKALCILLDQPEKDWKKTLQQFGSKVLQSFDRDNLSAKQLDKIRKYLESEPDPDGLMKVSSAAAGLCNLLHGVYGYAVESKKVAPLLAAKQEAETALANEQIRLDKATAELDDVMSRIAESQKKLDDTEAEKQRLIAEKELTVARLERAGKLTSGLGDAAESWKITVQQLDISITNLVGDAFLSAACISYYGPFTGPFRVALVKRWMHTCRINSLPCSDLFSLSDVLSDPIELREWSLKGLPSDPVSINNGILVTRAKRWPLMIDPQTQANKWIKNMYHGQLKNARPTTPRFDRLVEQAIRYGVPFLYEDIKETIEPLFDPILVLGAGSTPKTIRFNDQEVDYETGFKFFVTTKLPNPHYLPELCIKVTVINFTVTLEGLEQQLLGDVVDIEAAEISQKHRMTVLDVARCRKELSVLAEQILERLANSGGNLIDDEEFIAMLETSRDTSADVEERLKESAETSRLVDDIRNKYASVATRGSLLYFVVADLANVNSMYQFSLSYFVSLFKAVITRTQGQHTADERVEKLKSAITDTIFNNVCRGLFEEDKIVFAFLIASQFLRVEQKAISPAEWSFLLRGPALGSDSKASPPPNPFPEIMESHQWSALFALQSIVQDEKLSDICQLISANSDDKWRLWLRSAEPHLEPLPANLETSRQLTYFQKMLVVRAVRDEKIGFAISELVKRTLGNQFVDFKLSTMEDVFADSDNITPVVFILSAGADPTSQLLKFADEMGKASSMRSISLGQGQEGPARMCIGEGCKSGSWVLLQNCHLARTFMPQLELLVEECREAADRVDPGFRLFLTSMPKEYFPAPILQNSVKLTTEPPSGLKANLRRSMLDTTDTMLNDECDKPATWKKLRFGLMFFHATVQERKKFGPLGWNVRYEFNDSDLETSLTVLKNMLKPTPEVTNLLSNINKLQQRRGSDASSTLSDSTDSVTIEAMKVAAEEARLKSLSPDSVPWETLLFVIGQINYGGRVTDDWDRRCLMNILEKFVQKSVLSEGYKFSQSGLYFAPPDGTAQSYRDYIENLPSIDPPEVFGMHGNADISFQRQRSIQLLDTVLKVQPREAPANEKDDDDDHEKKPDTEASKKDTKHTAVGKKATTAPKEEEEKKETGPLTSDAMVLKTVEWLLSELPHTLTKDGAHNSTFKLVGDVMTSLGTNLFQEMERFNRLLNKIHSTCSLLKRAVKGEVIMSEDLDTMYVAFFQNKVPSTWSSVSYPSLKPLVSWFEDLKLRVQFLRDWIQKGRPKTFWISAFFFPQGFLTAVLQSYSRRVSAAIDTLSFEFEIVHKNDPLHLIPQINPETGEVESTEEAADDEYRIINRPADISPADWVPPPAEMNDRCVIRGMFMDGARWDADKHILADQLPGKTLEPAPFVRMIPKRHYSGNKNCYEMPLYKTSVRAGTLSTTGHSTNFVIAIDMPTDKPQSYWVLQGAALLSMKDD